MKSGLQSVSCLHRSEAKGKKMDTAKGCDVLVVLHEVGGGQGMVGSINK